MLAGMAVLGAAAMGEGQPYDDYQPLPPPRHTQRPPPPSTPLQRQRRCFFFPLLFLQQHLPVLAAAVAASVVGGWAIAHARSGLARWGVVKGLWVWHALREGRKPNADASSSVSLSYVSPAWALLQGALSSAAAVGVQVCEV
jgi:hypothetical protein